VDLGLLLKEPTHVAVEPVPMTTYQLWEHGILGVFAVRLCGGHVTGVVGPWDLRTAVRNGIDLEALVYDEEEEALLRFVYCPEQFYPLGLWLQGRTRRPKPRKQ
jgi:hypothetical protein